MNKIVIHMGDRVVHWVVPAEIAALLAQNLVSAIGPAEEGEE